MTAHVAIDAPRAAEPGATALPERPLVSIGVPVYNGAAFLDRALDTLVRQTYPVLEILVIDNGSTDETPAIAARWARDDTRVRHVRFDETIPVVPNFRRALAHASGTYFAWNAADDWRDPEVIADCLAAFASCPGAVMVAGPVIADDVKAGRRVRVEPRFDLTAADPAERVVEFTRNMQHAAMLYGLYRRDVLARLTFPSHSGQDYLVCLQACVAGPVLTIARPIITYRHVWGETDTPMYRVERPTARDLLVYRGVRRRKCWTTLLTGAWYILRVEGASPLARLRAAAAHAAAFTRRYWTGLLTECAFMLAEPAATLLRPLVPAGRRLKHRWRRSPAASG